MIDIEKFIWSLKINWVKRLQTESNSLLKHLYENVFKQFGGNILFECNFREANIIKHFNKKKNFSQRFTTSMVKTCQKTSYIKLSKRNHLEQFQHSRWRKHDFLQRMVSVRY